MRLLRLHPAVARRSCDYCKAYMHEDYHGQMGPVKMLRDGSGPQPRVPGTKTPCAVCPKIPHGAEPKPENAVELTARTEAAYQHYLECKAVGEFPNDPIVRYTAVLIRQAEESCERADSRRLALTVLGQAFRGANG